MNDDWLTWRHVFKLDPDRELAEAALERLCLSGTDAIIVGGSTGVTYDNTVDLLARIRRYAIPCVLEVSVIEAVVPGFDAYLVPIVLNTMNAEWLIGQHVQAIRRLGSALPWDRVMAEGYMILNPDSTAARVTEAYPLTAKEDAIAFALLADRLMRLPIVYVEYSGMFGDMELVGRIRAQLSGARLLYGGGIDGEERAAAALAAADTIIVGNVIYDNIEAALRTVDVAITARHS